MIALLLALQAATPSTVPPPPQPIVDCFAPGPFIVFFDRDSAVIGAEARAVLRTFARVEKEHCAGPFRFAVTGHADRGEGTGIDARRAGAVRRFLIGLGLRDLIGATRGLGTTVPRVLRPAGVEDRQNRRVELDPLPGG